MAYPKKEHDYKRLEEDLKSDELTNVRAIILYGHEDYLVKSYGKRIKNLYINPACEELDYIRLDGNTTSVETIINHLETLPMMSQKRVVAIDNYPALSQATGIGDAEKENKDFFQEEEIKTLVNYLKDIPETSLLIFLSSSVDTRKSLCKNVNKVGKIYNFEKLDRKDLSSFIKKRFKACDKVADDSVTREIINGTGYFDRDSEYNLNAIANDVIKISSFAKDRIITHADVSGVLAITLETNAFAFIDSLGKGNKNDAMLLVNNILGTGESAFRLLGLITSQYELMLGIKELSIREKGKNEIMNELGISSDYRYKKVSENLNRYTVEDLEIILQNLYNIEKNIKSGIYSEKLAMTMFVAEN